MIETIYTEVFLCILSFVSQSRPGNVLNAKEAHRHASNVKTSTERKTTSLSMKPRLCIDDITFLHDTIGSPSVGGYSSRRNSYMNIRRNKHALNWRYITKHPNYVCLERYQIFLFFLGTFECKSKPFTNCQMYYLISEVHVIHCSHTNVFKEHHPFNKHASETLTFESASRVSARVPRTKPAQQISTQAASAYIFERYLTDHREWAWV